MTKVYVSNTEGLQKERTGIDVDKLILVIPSTGEYLKATDVDFSRKAIDVEQIEPVKVTTIDTN